MNNRQGQGLEDYLRILRGASASKLLPFVGLAALVLIVGSIAWGWWFFPAGILFYALFLFLTLRNVTKALSSVGGLTPAGTQLSPSRVDLRRLDGKYKAYVQRALDTRANIEQAIEGTSDPGVKRALADAVRDLPELIDTIYTLAFRSQSVQNALLSSNTMQGLLADTQRLDGLIKTTTDDFQKSQYQATLDGKLQQMQNLTDTEVALQRWDAQMDNALSTLDTILSQVLRIKSSEVLSYTGATDAMSKTLRQEVDSLKATSDALDSVYGLNK